MAKQTKGRRLVLRASRRPLVSTLVGLVGLVGMPSWRGQGQVYL